MNSAFEPPVFTLLDAVVQAIAGLAYLAVGVAAWAAHPRDLRTRLFLGVALASMVGFAVPIYAWMYGIVEMLSLPRAAWATMLVSLAIGSLLLFHFSQEFPRTRPWIRRWGRWIRIGYVAAPAAAAGLVALAPTAEGADNVVPFLLAVVAIGLPLLVLLGIVLPVGGILSLVKSYREARDGETRSARTPLAWLLISQIAGGTIALIFAPVLAVIAPNATVQAALKIVVTAFGLMTPAGFALAVWKYRMPDQLP